MSTTPTASSNGSELGLTEHDRKFLETAITCLKSPPELDIPKLAEKMGVKPKTISNKWGELRKKLFANVNEDAVGAGPSTPRKRKAPAGSGEGGSAKKTSRSTKGKKAAQTEVVDADEDEDQDAV